MTDPGDQNVHPAAARFGGTDDDFDLFSAPTEAHARASDPGTSHDAADAVRMSDLQALALEGLTSLGGRGTSKDIAAHLGVGRDSISPRMKPLESKGLVRRDGKKDGLTVWVLS